LADVNRRTGTTLVIITHNAVIGEMADRVVRMQDGHVTEIKAHAVRKSADEVEW
jgi:putative ABC transport system ATP-binding protein